jgi:2-dehydro-3-deoxyphosphogluconate aldolase/(4S)-4-hydroxy-2-oxoglutarate aldolase
MLETGVVPIYYHPNIEVMKGLMRACFEGGSQFFEMTNRGDFAHEMFAELRKWANREFPGLIFGIGTIADAGTCSLFIQKGADFIVSAALHEDVARVCNRRKVLWIPGCGTVTEISKAEELGAEVIKVFPADVLGTNFIEAVKGPMPWTNIIVTRGVEPNEESLAKWFKSGIAVAGLGSTLFTAEIMKGPDYARVRQLIAESLDVITKIKAAVKK